ncbi:9839_t:CDS:2 [Paraglomus occultum]|uniref:Golgi apparatus membrane protein TVP38 n=1 Tax=Paraglomus occultum TaxID=144539 RepID=A0A9N9FW81_9GLOM|nr:9839_t:CDS:2 [Paraglomus occultum]
MIRIEDEQITLSDESSLRRTKQRWLLAIGTLLVIALVVLFFVFEEPIMKALAPFAESVRSTRYGYLIMGGLVALSSFPPIPGYSALVLACGFIYGFPLGFVPAFAGAVIGATASFWLFRKAFKKYVRRLLANRGNFAALSVAVQEGGFKIIFLIRLSPFPFTYSNAFFASLHTVSFPTFLLATVLSLPKLFAHIFIGSRLGNLSLKNMDKTSKLVNYLTIAIGGLLFIIATYYVYQKTNKIAKEAAKRRITGGLGNDSEVFLQDEEAKIEMSVAGRANENGESSETDDERQNFTQENRHSLQM